MFPKPRHWLRQVFQNLCWIVLIQPHWGFLSLMVLSKSSHSKFGLSGVFQIIVLLHSTPDHETDGRTLSFRISGWGHNLWFVDQWWQVVLKPQTIPLATMFHCGYDGYDYETIVSSVHIIFPPKILGIIFVPLDQLSSSSDCSILTFLPATALLHTCSRSPNVQQLVLV